MQSQKVQGVHTETHILTSLLLSRDVKLTIFYPIPEMPQEEISLLLINDGQDLPVMDFETILTGLYTTAEIAPVFL